MSWRFRKQLTKYLPIHPLDQVNKWPRNASYRQRTNERPGHRRWESEMIIVWPQTRCDIPKGQSIRQDIMGRLDTERLLDFGVRSKNEMKEDEQGHERGEEGI